MRGDTRNLIYYLENTVNRSTPNCVNMDYMKRSSREATPHKIHVSLALEALQEASEEVRKAQDTLDANRAVRDDLIRDAYDSGVAIIRLVRITGLSRERIYRITHGDPRGV